MNGLRQADVRRLGGAYMKRQLRIILIVIIAAVAATAVIFAVKYIKNGIPYTGWYKSRVYR